jgi:uncharacterized membrane protein
MTPASWLPTARTHYFAVAVLGFAFGGFFDGILLHQVLQWHHFLSLVAGEPFQHIEVQILADGLFHLAIWVIAFGALVLLWRRGQDRPADRLLLAWSVLGFSIWQFFDVVLVHWVIGIHRTRVGVSNPLLWDLGWLAAFGLTTLIIGLWLLTRSEWNGGNGRRVAGLISGCIIISALATILPTRGSSSSVVLFHSEMNAAQTFAVAASVDADILWSDPSGRVLVVNVPNRMGTWRLYTQGALLVANTTALGCLSLARS